jgi:hypothetical protein
MSEEEMDGSFTKIYWWHCVLKKFKLKNGGGAGYSNQ